MPKILSNNATGYPECKVQVCEAPGHFLLLGRSICVDHYTAIMKAAGRWASRDPRCVRLVAASLGGDAADELFREAENMETDLHRARVDHPAPDNPPSNVSSLPPLGLAQVLERTSAPAARAQGKRKETRPVDPEAKVRSGSLLRPDLLTAPPAYRTLRRAKERIKKNLMEDRRGDTLVEKALTLNSTRKKRLAASARGLDKGIRSKKTRPSSTWDDEAREDSPIDSTRSHPEIVWVMSGGSLEEKVHRAYGVQGINLVRLSHLVKRAAEGGNPALFHSALSSELQRAIDVRIANQKAESRGRLTICPKPPSYP